MQLRRMSTTVALLVICGAALNAQEQRQMPLTNDDVARMVSGGLGEGMIVAAIGANEVNFVVSPNGLLALKEAGVSDKIVEAMLAAETRKRDAAARAAQGAPSAGTYASVPRVGAMGVPIMNSPGALSQVRLPEVALRVGDRKIPLRPSTTEIAQSKGKGGSKAGGVLKGFGKGVRVAGGMAGAPMPGMGGGRAPRMPGVALYMGSAGASLIVGASESLARVRDRILRYPGNRSRQL